MTITKMVKSMALIFALLTTSWFSFAQDSYIKERWDIKLGHAKYEEVGDLESNFRMELNYGVTDFLEAGAYFGVGFIDLEQILNFTSNSLGYMSTNGIILGYGINVNFHVLPFFVDDENFRFDLYTAGRFGGKTVPNIPEGYSKYYVYRGTNGNELYEFNIDRKFDPEYAVGIGAAFHPLYHLGLFAEFYYGKFHFSNDFYRDKFLLRYGLSFKF